MPSTTQTARREPAAFGTAASALVTFGFGVRRNLANWPILMGRALFYLIAMIVLSSLWNTVSAQRLPGTLVGALPPGGLTLYFGVTEWITLSVASIHLRLEDEIRFGLLEPYLLRPKPYLVQKIAEAMGDSVGRLIGIGAAALAALAMSGHAMPSGESMLHVLVLAPPAIAIGVQLYAIVGLSAFWVRRVLPPYLIVQKAWFLLGGLFAPITLYPPWLFEFARATPFAASLFLVGQEVIAPSLRGLGLALAAQAIWIAILSALAALVWRAGMRKVLREGV